jgi:hypothetical protein
MGLYYLSIINLIFVVNQLIMERYRVRAKASCCKISMCASRANCYISELELNNSSKEKIIWKFEMGLYYLSTVAYA